MKKQAKRQGFKLLRKTGYLLTTFVLLLGFIAPTAIAAGNSQNSTTSSSVQQVAAKKFTLDQYTKTSALELAKLVRSGDITSEQLVNLALEKVKKDNPKLNAVITLRAEKALQEARDLKDQGQPFLGVPLLIKGLGQALKGESNTNGFGFAKTTIAEGTTKFVQELQAAGFIIIGQTNFPELGFKNITDDQMYGPAHNPWNDAYQPGGSSGGAGASLADGMVPIASGSDAGGSIRIPASWTGTIGLKPSRGIIVGNSNSAHGQTVHFALTRTMADTTALFEALKDPKRLTSNVTDLQQQTIAYSTKSPVGTPVSAEAIKAVTEAVAFLRAQGFKVVQADAPVDGVKLMQGYYAIAASSASIANYIGKQNLGRDITIHDVDLLTWGLYQAGLTQDKNAVAEAWQFNEDAAEKMATFHQRYPLYLTPTTATTAPKVGESQMTTEHIKQMENITALTGPERTKLIYDQWLTALKMTPYTQLENLTGEPAISLPTHVAKNGLPLGIQFNAGLNQDELLLQMGQLFESQHQFKALVPIVAPDESGTGSGSGSGNESSSSESQSSSSSESKEPSNSISSSTAQSHSSAGSTSNVANESGQVFDGESNQNNSDASTERNNKGQNLPQTSEKLSVYYILLGGSTVLLAAAIYTRKIRK